MNLDEYGGHAGLAKCPSGVPGFDEVTAGGLPRGRTRLVCGPAGCGKTLFGLQFLVRGAVDHGEPGVFLAFEETAEDLVANVASLGFDLGGLVERELIAVDPVRVERSEIDEAGDDGQFLRLAAAIDSVGAKRVIIDTLETLFAGLSDHAILRSELRRLFHRLKERGDGALTRHGLEEYVSDGVILLDHRVRDQVSTRRLRVVGCRGSTHGIDLLDVYPEAEGVLDEEARAEAARRRDRRTMAEMRGADAPDAN
jgi:circadian clock protein KaiC